MTIGLTRKVQILVSACCLMSVAAAADALQEVMKALARVEHSEVSFREEKHMAMLDLALIQSGRLSYTAPDRLVRSLDEPVGGRFIVQGDQITLEHNNRKKTHAVNDLPMVRAFVASFGATLAGDLAELQKYYAVSFSGAESSWKLQLLPKGKELASYVDEIRLWGAFGKIAGMEVYEANGDWSRMILLHD